MKINLIEPLSISQEMLDAFKKELEKKGHQFTYYMDKAKSLEEQKKRVGDAHILMIANSKLYNEALSDDDNLEYINVAFTGYDHIDIDYLKKRNIKASNASGYSDIAVAELVVGHAINALRQIGLGSTMTKEGKSHEAYYKGREIKGKTLGVIGTGKIGMEVLRLFKAFGANLIAYSRTEKKEAIDMGVKYLPLEDLLSQADIVTIHLPLNDETKGFLGRQEFKKMKKSSVLINCARGPIIDNLALKEALNEGEIAYACVDVFDYEPPLKPDYPLVQAKNICLSPHIAYLTEESMVRRAEIVFDNTLAYLDGQVKNRIV